MAAILTSFLNKATRGKKRPKPKEGLFNSPVDYAQSEKCFLIDQLLSR